MRVWLIAAIAVAATSCTGDRVTRVPEPPAPPGETVAIELSESSSKLRFTYLDSQGKFQLAERPSQVPKDARGAVMVADFGNPSGAGEQVVVVDLRETLGGDRYPARKMERAAFERLARSRLDGARPPIVMYATSWCGVCSKARAFLKGKGARYMERDVEKDPGAAQELRDKAAKAGVKTQGVPVFDLGGRIVSGYDQGTLERYLQSSSL
jgi:glutaredoxin